MSWRSAITTYGPQARYEDPSLRKHNGPATPGRIVMDFQNGSLQQEHLSEHVADHDITVDQSGALQYIQLLHHDGSVQIIRSGFMNIRFYPD